MRLARIAGVDLPRDKRVEVALTYVYGVGTIYQSAGAPKPMHLIVHTCRFDMKDCPFRGPTRFTEIPLRSSQPCVLQRHFGLILR